VPKANILQCGKERHYSITSSTRTSSDCGTECLRGFEIDDQFILGGRLHWLISCLFALENAIISVSLAQAVHQR
jgi:hypothetical protein